MPKLSDRIKRERKRLGLSQETLSQLCGVKQPTIANWERGGNIPRQDALQRLAQSLNVKPDWLLTGNIAAESTPAYKHITTPIRNIPVYNWAETQEEFTAAQPSRYITMSVDGDSLFAMDAPADADFKDGTVLIFDGNATTGGQTLAQVNGQIQLNDADTETGQTLGKLIYSMQPH